jgi:hypothetical protein
VDARARARQLVSQIGEPQTARVDQSPHMRATVARHVHGSRAPDKLAAQPDDTCTDVGVAPGYLVAGADVIFLAGAAVAEGTPTAR